MKKRFSYMLILLIVVLRSVLCYAGDVPEGLLNTDSSQVYFGEVKSIEENSITVIQKKNIKGEFSENKEYTYSDYVFTDSPEAGEVYLCGFYDENNPLYIWEVTSLETDSLEIKNTDDMSKRMQKYLNEGKFEEKEAERLSKTNINNDAQSPSAAAPSEISAAHEVQKDNEPDRQYFSFVLIPLAIVFIGICAFIFRRKRRN